MPTPLTLTVSVVVACVVSVAAPAAMDEPADQQKPWAVSAAESDRLQLGEPPTAPKGPEGIQLPGPDEAWAPAWQLNGPVLTVSPASRAESRAFFVTNYRDAAAPLATWTGNPSTCDAGTTAAAFRDSVLLRVNYFRAMAGVPAHVSFADTYNTKGQQAALMMSVNNQLSHSPPASWLCYSAGGAEAAGKSNLCLGDHGVGAITAYMKDVGAGNGAAGHRSWILYAQTQTMGTGDLPPEGGRAANALWLFDTHMWDPRPPSREEFVAWPPPGYVPYQVVFPRWSFSYANADFSQASVSVAQGQQSIAVQVEPVTNGYGENTLVWIPSGMSSGQSWPRTLRTE